MGSPAVRSSRGSLSLRVPGLAIACGRVSEMRYVELIYQPVIHCLGGTPTADSYGAHAVCARHRRCSFLMVDCAYAMFIAFYRNELRPISVACICLVRLIAWWQ